MTKCGWASIDEKGNARGGQAGDQSGKEVKTGNWYYFDQKYVLRWKDEKLAKKYAKFIQAICDNPCVGYDQSQRKTLFQELVKINWDYSKLKTPCEVDCSELTRCGLYYVGIKIDSNVYTGNMILKYKATEQFEVLTDQKYLTSGDYLATGDIVVAEGRHTISVLEDGKNSVTTSSTSTYKLGVARKYDNNMTGSYIVTASYLHLRVGAGIDKKSITTMKKGTIVKNYGYYNVVDGVIWYYIKYGSYIGFASSKYLIKK